MHLAPDVPPLRVGPGHVPEQVAVRPGVGVEQQRQVAGDQASLAVRGQDGEAVPPHELVQLGRVGLGEGGGDVHARFSGNAVGPRAQKLTPLDPSRPWTPFWTQGFAHAKLGQSVDSRLPASERRR